MDQQFSRESKFTDIDVILSNFQGLQYDTNEDTEYEVIASYMNINLTNHRIQINRKSLPVVIIKIPINTADGNEITNLFLNPLLLTLIKHENEQSNTVGYCNIDLSIVCSTKCESIKCLKRFHSQKMVRKITCDVKAFTKNPLLDTKYGNIVSFKLESICNYENVESDKLLVSIIAPNEVFTGTTFKVNLQKKLKALNSECNNSENKQVCKGSTISTNFNHEIFHKCHHPHQCTEFNAKFLIFSTDACLAFHDHIKKFKYILMELMLNENVHLFGLIDCEQLLHVGIKSIRVSVPLYRYEHETFKILSHCNSAFYKPDLELTRKSKRVSRKSKNVDLEPDKLLEDIKALNDEGMQIIAVINMELEKPLNEEISYESYKGTHSHSINYHSKIIDVCGIKNAILRNKSSVEIENSINFLFDHFQESFDVETFLCKITSDINNFQRIPCNRNQKHKLISTEIYKSIDMINKSEEILLHDIHKNRTSAKAWLNYAIFNAKLEEFNKMAIAVDELLGINPQSLISNILKAYLLFKSLKYSESLNLISHLMSIYSEVEELDIMQYVINDMLGIKSNLASSTSKKNEEIENIYSRPELLWSAVRDEGLLSWQNPFIKSAIFFIKIGCYDVAELCLGEYYKAYGINVNYLYLLAAIDTSKGNYKGALYHLNRISENDIVNHNVNYNKIINSIILNLLHTKNFKKAAEIFNTYIQIESCDNFLILYLLGTHFNRINEYVTAKEFLIQASKTFNCHVVYRELGKCFVGLNLMKMAEKAFVNALHFDINDVGSMMSLRKIYKIQSRHDAINFCDYNIQYINDH